MRVKRIQHYGVEAGEVSGKRGIYAIAHMRYNARRAHLDHTGHLTVTLGRATVKVRCQNSSALARGGRRRGVQLWDGQRPTDGHLDGQLAP